MSISKNKIEKKIKFRDRVLEVVKNIPKGSALSYKQVAQKAGSPKAYRAVGSIMNSNRDSDVPCHRVIRSDGQVGDYNKGKKKKRELLKGEGFLS